MAELGQNIANTYLLPQDNNILPPEQQQIARTSGALPKGAVPDPAEGLQYTIDDTRAYYEKWSKLKNFVHTMDSSFGIDVTKPDFSDPASLRANELYTKAVADIMFQGDQLKNSQTMLEQMMARRAAGTSTMEVDPRQQALSTVDPREAEMTTKAGDLVNNINKKTQQRFYTSSEYKQAQGVYDSAVQNLEQLATNDPENAEYYARQIQMLTPPTKSTKIFAPKNDTVGTKVNAAGNLLRKVSNMVMGAGDNWNPSVDPTKFETSEFEGLNYGSYVGTDGRKKTRVVDKWIHDPETGEVTIMFQNEDAAPQVVSQSDALQVARELVSANTRFGNTSDLDKYVNEYSLLNEEGEVDPNKLLSPKFAREQERRLKEVKELKPKIEKAKFAIKTSLGELSGRPLASPAVYTIPEEFGGGQLEVKRHFSIGGTGKWYIDNIKELYPDMKSKDAKAYEQLDQDQVIKLLTNLGVLESLITDSGSEVVPTIEDEEDLL